MGNLALNDGGHGRTAWRKVVDALVKLTLAFRTLILFSVLLLSSWCSVAQTMSVSPRIAQAVDEKRFVALPGNAQPLARPEFDQGPISDAQPLRRMLLLLQRSPDQLAALQKLLDEQQDKSSPNYHAWLTPEEFGKQFGPADPDIQILTNWLTKHGFTDINVGTGRTAIEFSGNVASVRNAFHTEIHRYLVDGEEHIANASAPQIPAALAQRGTHVTGGQQIGTIDISGCTSAPHTHIQRKVNGVLVNFTMPCDNSHFDDPSTYYDDSDGTWP